MQNKELADAFYKDWETGKHEFEIKTSGSTGQAKTIVLNRKIMQWSAMQTALAIKPLQNDKILCCLPISKVGGLMQLVRAIEWKIPIEIIEPIANPLLIATDNTIISLTPYQLHSILNNEISVQNLRTIKKVIIGGSELNEHLEKKINELKFTNTQFWHSYGMTETYSHIALRAINGKNKSEWFVAFKDIVITKNEENCAIIQLPFLNITLETTDVIELINNNQFKIIGRADNIINTGGVKIQAEEIEKLIIDNLKTDINFYISSLPDELLGNKIILIAEPNFNYTLNSLLFIKEKYPYGMPKEIIFVDKIERNESGKILRKRG